MKNCFMAFGGLFFHRNEKFKNSTLLYAMGHIKVILISEISNFHLSPMASSGGNV